jgi:UPF0755 protein
MSILPFLPRSKLTAQRGGFLSVCLALVTLVGVLAAAAWWWINQPMALPQGAAIVDLRIAPKSSARSIANAVAASGVQVNPVLLFLYFRLSGDAKTLRAGSYEIATGTSPQNLADKLTRGDQALVSVTIVEGWTFRQIRQMLEATPQLKATSRSLSEPELMGLLGKPGLAAEGRFFPDTYSVAKGGSDMEVLKSALRAMDKQLQAAWEARNPNIPLKSPEEALTLASIVEKETGKASDRTTISGVFNNRLRIGMRLQTDPTVIYGMGQSFDGNIRKRDLQTDTPWNTYTRNGLPPTPIAMPGKAALLAAVQPEDTKALYFVARGDGSSQFSASLDEHNRAVNKYIRGQ